MTDLFDNFDLATQAAAELTATTGVEHVVNYRGSGAITPYDIARLPQVGDEVSYAFNGDAYPCGVIEHISASGEKIVTSTGRIFRRPRRLLVDRDGREFKRNQWKADCWSLVQGVHDKRNPHF